MNFRLGADIRERLSKLGYRGIGRLLRLLGFRFLRVPKIERVGHLALDFDSYLKDQILSGRRVHPIYLFGEKGAPPRPANQALMDLWGRHIWLISSPFWRRLLQPFMKMPELVDELRIYSFLVGETARCYDVQGRWRGRPPIISLSSKLRKRGRAVLREMGVPDDAWFVCVHAREGGYSPRDEWAHVYRNVDIASYDLAIDAIIARGGWCIRMGDASMVKPPGRDRFIDYAHSPWKSDWMDIYLCATCRFFFGDTSGLFNVTGIFGGMSVLTNMTPISCAYSQFPNDTSIPKTIAWSDGRRIGFAEAFSSEVGAMRFAPAFEKAGVVNLSNTPEEILDLVTEVMDRLENRAVYTAEDEMLQERFRSLMRPGHYAWPPYSRIGRDFLRAHAGQLGSARGERQPEASGLEDASSTG